MLIKTCLIIIYIIKYFYLIIFIYFTFQHLIMSYIIDNCVFKILELEYLKRKPFPSIFISVPIFLPVLRKREYYSPIAFSQMFSPHQSDPTTLILCNVSAAGPSGPHHRAESGCSVHVDTFMIDMNAKLAPMCLHFDLSKKKKKNPVFNQRFLYAS